MVASSNPLRQVKSVAKGAWSSVKGKVRGRERSREELRDGIANFYDASSGVWEDMWGEHMHHGLYEVGKKPQSIEEHRAAQVKMIDSSLAWAGVDDGAPPHPYLTAGLDVGCGIGGSSRHISRKYGTEMTGITLSPLQRSRAQAISEAAGLGDKCQFQVVDALDQPFADNSFDLIWSMESGEHMPEKQQFVNELCRVTAPGGRIIIVTWCHRDLKDGEDGLNPKEASLLRKINRAYYLPKWCSVSDYVTYCKEAGLTDIRREDWTDHIQYFWPAVIKSSLSTDGVIGLLKSGPTTIRGALAMLLMVKGFDMDLIKFGLITAKKPEQQVQQQQREIAEEA
ncbi:unnamed protein product [Chrysoparadoxa australica]